MATIPEAVALAIQHHQAGRLEEAERLYRQILAADPQHADAWNSLGVIAYQTGNHDQAAKHLRCSIQVNPYAASVHNNLGIVHRAIGNLDEARASFEQALALDPMNAEAHVGLAGVFHKQENMSAAAACYQRALVLKPDCVEALLNFGATLQVEGKLDEAAVYYRRALRVKPDLAEAHLNLGGVLQNLGNLSEAVIHYQKVAELHSHDADAQTRLGIILNELGRFEETASCYRRALELQPDQADVHNLLGLVSKNMGKLDAAAASYRRALELQPDLGNVHNNLGVVLMRQKKFDEAEVCFRRALELTPNFFGAYTNLGGLLVELGKLDEAIGWHRRALELNPNDAGSRYNLGCVLQKQLHLEEAATCFRQALQIKPNLAEAHNLLGSVLQLQGKLDEAAESHRRSLELQPDLAEANNNLAGALRSLGALDEALQCFQRALELNPDNAETYSNFLHTLSYCGEITISRLAKAHAEYEQRYAAKLQTAWKPHDNVRDAERRLRVGFISPDFGRHPVCDFLIQTLENLDQEQVEIICYSDRRLEDEWTVRFRTAATCWRAIVDWNDERVAQQVVDDQIDILFDLTGHTASNRLLAFARKPAPVQITWIGYEGTTGLSSMDYILADQFLIPIELERHYCERVLRAPDSFACYEPPKNAPPVVSLPALKRGSITFGCFNNPTKITPDVIKVWARILRAMPESHLALKYKGVCEPSSIRRLQEGFEAHGIDPCRLDFWAHSPYTDHLLDYQQIDIALDPFPFSGGATTCEALWMGVPVITCPGETFASRHSLSHLSNIGLTETIAQDLNEYVEIAMALAQDLSRLAALRAGLREQMAASPLCDGPRFARNFMALLREVWQEWVRRSV